MRERAHIVRLFDESASTRIQKPGILVGVMILRLCCVCGSPVLHKTCGFSFQRLTLTPNKKPWAVFSVTTQQNRLLPSNKKPHTQTHKKTLSLLSYIPLSPSKNPISIINFYVITPSTFYNPNFCSSLFFIIHLNPFKQTKAFSYSVMLPHFDFSQSFTTLFAVFNYSING